jgi:putative tricarboxylic transport membrane protein
MKKYDLVGGLIWIALGVGLCVGSMMLKLGHLHRPGTGFMPFLSGVSLVILGLILVFSSTSKRLREEKGLGEKKLWVKGNWKTFVFTLLALFGYAFLFEILGFITATFLFFLFLFKLGNPKKWLGPLVLSGATVVLSYLVFSVWLMCPFPKGIFGF